MAMLRSLMSQSDGELRSILDLEGDLADVPLEEALRTMVEGLKESQQEFRIFEEGEGWIRDIELRMVSAQDPLLRVELLKLADLIRVVRILTEQAVLELSEEGMEDEARRSSTECPEVRARREAERREAIFRLISETVEPRDPSEDPLEAEDLEYGIAAYGDLEDVLSVDREGVLSGAWLQRIFEDRRGDLLVARSVGSAEPWRALSHERTGEIVEAVEECCADPAR